MKNFRHITFLLALIASFSLHAQNDTIKKKESKFKTILDGRNNINGIQLGKQEKLNPIFDLNKKPEKPLKGFDYYLNLGNPKQNINLQTMSSKSPIEDDVYVKRSFNGKDTSDSTVKSHVGLGTFESSTKYIRIEFADHGLVDGDRVRIFLNDQIVEENIMLTGISAFIKLKMKKGYNKIDFSALNQGRYGPNTAAFRVFDDKGKVVTEKAWNLAKNENATLGIIRY